DRALACDAAVQVSNLRSRPAFPPHERARFEISGPMDGRPSANVSTDDPEATADLVLELLATAGRQGIAPKEIYEEVDSLFHLLSEAM
ncbi:MULTISPECIES: hypothetical protein, partial [unclassified Mesorhizobium]